MKGSRPVVPRRRERSAPSAPRRPKRDRASHDARPRTSPTGGPMSFQELGLRLAAAALLGSAIGLERHWSDKAAGLRTHMLVSLGSALFTIVSVHGFDEVVRPSRVVLDPSRIASLVVSGIGFLGAGTILRRNETVLGLTTAASIWAVAAVGLAAGCGLYRAAGLSTGLILVVLASIRP